MKLMHRYQFTATICVSVHAESEDEAQRLALALRDRCVDGLDIDGLDDETDGRVYFDDDSPADLIDFEDEEQIEVTERMLDTGR